MNILSVATKLATFAVIVILLAVFGYAIFGDRVTVKTSPLVGGEAPEFTLRLFNGDRLKLSDLRGKAVLLNFWASWCGPCKEEAPALESSWQRYRGEGVVFLGVNVWDDQDSARAYVERFGGGYLNGIDPKGEIAVEFGVGGVPETYFIDASGKVVDKYTGQLTEGIIDQFLGKALTSSGQDGLSKKE